MLDGTKAVCIMNDNARMSPAPHSKPPWPLEHSSSFFYFICVPLRLYVRQKMWMPGSLEGAAGTAQVNKIPKPVDILQGETQSCSKLLCVLRLSHFVPGGRATVVLRTEASTLKMFQKSERKKLSHCLSTIKQNTKGAGTDLLQYNPFGGNSLGCCLHGSTGLHSCRDGLLLFLRETSLGVCCWL